MDIKNYFNDITDVLSGGYEEKLTYYQIDHDFVIPIGFHRNHYDPGYKPYDLKLSIGDIIGVGSMLYQDTDRQTRRINLCRKDNKFHPVTISREFFELNRFLFKDVTIQILRDYKLNKIIK